MNIFLFMNIFRNLTFIFVVRTFGKHLTIDQINAFIDEDNMKYIIFEYCGEKYFACKGLEGTSNDQAMQNYIDLIESLK